MNSNNCFSKINEISNSSYSKTFKYSNYNELKLYLNELSNALYGVDYYNLYFLNKNVLDFSTSNVLISSG